MGTELAHDRLVAEKARIHRLSREYHAQGLSVIPLTHPWDASGHSKSATVQWKRYSTRRPTLAEIDGWFGPDAPKLANIGIVTGPISGLLALNLTGMADRELASKLQELPLPDLWVKTEHGEHWLYGWDDRYGIQTGVRLSGIEVIADSGYIVAPGSRTSGGDIYSLIVDMPGAALNHLTPLPEAIQIQLSERRHPIVPIRPILTTINTEEEARAVIQSRGAMATLRFFRNIDSSLRQSEDSRLVCLDLSGLGISPDVIYKAGKPDAYTMRFDPQQPTLPLCERWRPESAARELVGGDDQSPTANEIRMASGAKPMLANVEYLETEDAGKIKEVAIARPLAVVRKEVIDGLGGWPCTSAETLFTVKVNDEGKLPTVGGLVPPEVIWWFKNENDLFAWFHTVCDGVLWDNGTARASLTDPTYRSLPSKAEFFRLLREYPAFRYSNVETLPHYPPIGDSLYLLPELPTPDPNFPLWKQWLSLFNPETDEDRTLIAAACLTPLWGGPPGSRPAFLFTSRHGRGVGKSATAEAIAAIYGGSVNPAQLPEGPQGLPKALVSPEGMSKRCVIWDNLKGKQDYAVVESLITTQSIQSHRLYVGHAARPNYLTWMLTANRAETSTDLAQRCVPIEIGPPRHAVDFVGLARDFLARNRVGLIAEMLEILGPNTPPAWNLNPEDADRWQAWTKAVLCKLPGGEATLPIIARRRGAIDTDVEEAEMVVECIIDLMHQQDKVGSALDKGRFTFQTGDLYKLAVIRGLASHGPLAFSRWLSRKILDGDLKYLTPTRVRNQELGSHVRGYTFNPGPEHMTYLILGSRKKE